MDLKVCGVCGDKALGYNFNAVTCESCKAFFRRNALTKKDFRCPFNEQCDITTVTRRFCQKCRLEKCFTIGMRKDYIMSEEDKFLKRQKIEENRAKKRTYSSNGFKKGFKKMKKEVQQDDDSSQEYVESEGLRNEGGANNGNLVSVISYFRQMNDESSSIENVTSPEGSVNMPDEDSMIRTILNPTPKPRNPLASSEGEEEGVYVPPPHMNNNDISCNHNNTGRSKNITDTARDILEDVGRFAIPLLFLH